MDEKRTVPLDTSITLCSRYGTRCASFLSRYRRLTDTFVKGGAFTYICYTSCGCFPSVPYFSQCEWLSSTLLSLDFSLLKTAQSTGGTLPGVTEVQDAISTPTLTLSSLFPLAWLSPSPLVLS